MVSTARKYIERGENPSPAANLSTICRADGVYAVWYLNKNFGEETSAKFLTNLKQAQDWQKVLSNLTGKTIGQLGRDMQDQLKSISE